MGKGEQIARYRLQFLRELHFIKAMTLLLWGLGNGVAVPLGTALH